MSLAAALLLVPARDGPPPDAHAIARGTERDHTGAPSAAGGVGGVQAALNNGSFAAAESLAIALLAQGPTTLDSAQVLDLLTTALWRGGKAREPRSRQIATRAIAIKRSELGPDDPGVATSLRNLGILYE